MPDPYPGYLSYRVVDSNTGSEVVSDLPHLRQGLWKIRGLQPGVIGSATLGTFDIPIYAPADQGGWSAGPKYDLLGEGQRVEAYLGGSGDAVPYASGVITGLDRPMDAPWVIHGVDSLWWLQQSQLFTGETIGPGGAGSALVQQMSGTREVVFDQWANALTFSAPITNVTADPQFGLPGVSCNFNGLASAILGGFGSPWNANAQYSLPAHPSSAYASAITLWGVINADTNVSNSGSVGFFWLADSPFTTGYFVEATMVYSGSATTGYSVSVRLWSVSGGTFTALTAPTTAFTGIQSSVLPYQLQVVLYNNNNSGWNFRVILNGKDTGCVAAVTSLARSSGTLGIRFNGNGAGTNYATRLRFESRTGQYGTPGTWGTNRLQVGSLSSGTAVIPMIVGQGQTHLDLIQLAMALDGAVALKTPGRGYKGDTLTYGVLGADLSSGVRLEEGVNVVAQGTTVAALADQYSTVTRYSAVPGQNTGGTIEWPVGSLANPGDLVLTQTVTDVGAPDIALQLANAMAIQARVGNPLTALQVAFNRSPDFELGVTAKLYDRLGLNIPTLRLNHQVQQLIGWDFQEGNAVQTAYLNQFPLASHPQQVWGRMLRATQWLAQHQT